MCFYNSQSKRALALAKRYGRKTDILEIWQEIMEEKRRNGEILDLTDGAYNIPAYKSPYSAIITDSDQLQPMRWGLISHATKDWQTVIDKDKKNWYKNARAETAMTTWPYKLSIGKQRCIIPSTGFYEWHENPDGTKVPYFIHLPESDVFSIAEIWDKWINPETGKEMLSYVMLTTSANELLTEIHNSGQNPYRMPVIIREEDMEEWLNPNLTTAKIGQFLKPYKSDDMEAYQVSKDFRTMENIHNPEIIKKIA
jgi:putative SOS response-associated peptidase YedK